MTTSFIKHENCPSCGSKDNLGVWDDGHKFCFGCKYFERGITDLHKMFYPNTLSKKCSKNYPYDAQGDYFSTEALRWLYSCGINIEEARKQGIQWSTNQQLVCWKVHNQQGTNIAWQGRCFSKTAKTKYIIHGKVHESICLLGEQRPVNFCDDGDTTCVLVEDYLSAIRVSKKLPCVPLFGCTIKLEHLQTLSKQFSKIIVWLDSDKLDNARKIASLATTMVLDSRVLYTPEDPKNYSDFTIEKYLETFL